MKWFPRLASRTFALPDSGRRIPGRLWPLGLAVFLVRLDAGELVLESDQLSLRFTEETGAWVGLIDRRTGENLVDSGGSPVGPASGMPRTGTVLSALSGQRLDTSDGWKRLQLMARDGPWEYLLDIRVPDTGNHFSRQLSVRNVSAEEQVFRNGTLGTSLLRLGSNTAVVFPGSLPVGDQDKSKCGEGQFFRPRSEETLVVLWDAAAQRGLGTWYHTEEEFTSTTVRRQGDGFQVHHTQQAIARLKPRELLMLGRQYFWLTHGVRREAISGVQLVYERIKLRSPTNSLPGLSSMVMYCGHPGGVAERSFRGYGGFNALRGYLPTLQRLGIDLLWSLPIWEHGDGHEWNLYAPFDHFRISPLYGTPTELQALSGAATECGIRLMFDLVPHGPPDFTDLAKEHPEWTAQDPEGKPQRAWNQLAFDNAHPGWQDYMRKAAVWGAREFGAVGARVDCAAGGPANWNRAARNRPSWSGLWAGLGMTRVIRQGYVEACTNVVVLPEEYTGLNVYHRVADLTYDAQLYFLQMDLQARGASPESWATELQTFLQDQQQAMPPGALKMRWISNHDTVSWTYQKARPAKVYGVARMRALLALCAFIPGVPMLYQGDEDPSIWGGDGEPNVEFLARVYGLRKTLQALRAGEADYSALQASCGVFACQRTSPEQRVLILISFNPQPVVTKLQGAIELVGRWKDYMAGETLKLGVGAEVSMVPHQVRVLARE